MPTDYKYVAGQQDFSLAGFTTPAGPPANGTNGDTITFDDGRGTAATTPNAWQGVKFASATVTPGCAIDAGAVGSPVRFDCAGTVSFAGAGSKWALAGGTVDGTWAGLVWQPAAGCAGHFSSLTITGTAYVYGGTVVFTESVVLGSLEVANAQCSVLKHASDVLADVFVRAGAYVECRRRINGSIVIEDGGTLVYDVDENSTGTNNITLGGPRAKLVHIDGKLGGVGGGVVRGTGEYDRSRLKRSVAVAITDTASLREITGKVEPSFTRTTIGQAGAKIPG